MYLILWIVLLPPTVFFLLGLVLVAASPAGFTDAGLVSAVSGFCAALLGIPAFAFLLLWFQSSKRDRILKELGHLLGTFREIPIADVARQINHTEAETIDLIGFAVSEGHAKGWVDHQTGRFQNAAARHGLPSPSIAPAGPPGVPDASPPPAPAAKAEMRFCRKCGNRVYPLRESNTWQCVNCGNVQRMDD